jgi:hypothetical protein
MIRPSIIVAVLTLVGCESDADVRYRAEMMQDWQPQYLPSFQPIGDTRTIQVPGNPFFEPIQPIAPIAMPPNAFPGGCVGTVQLVGNSVLPCP